MSNKIYFKEWFATFFKGIWQALCWVGRAFNPKYKTKFWRIIWSVITICVVAVSGCLVHSYLTYMLREHRGYADIQRISHNYKFVKHYNGLGSIVHLSTGEVVQKGIEWIAIPHDEDSLIVYSKNGKCGFINRFSGEVSIPAKFTQAWLFSSGVAGVAVGDSVYFIDHFGKPINNKKLRYNPKNSGYVFHGDYCAIAVDNGMMGLIDRAGTWKIEPKYEWICRAPHNYWKMRQGDSENGLWYAFTDKAEPVNDMGVKELEISKDLGVIYTLPNHLKMVVDYEGNQMEKFLCRDIEAMYYDTEQRDSTNSFIPAKCTLCRYRMDDGYEGLCRENGDIVTEPLYWNVQPVSKDLYHCTYKDSGVGVIINSKGEITNS